MASIHHVRRQHPVGHGFFHSAVISIVDPDERDEFRYIYDCGSMTSDSEYRRAAINSWASADSTRDHLDLVYISHMDIDHRSGLEQLLDGRSVGTFILPLVDPAERAMSWASHQARGQSVSEADRRFVADPVGALSALSPGSQIILVTSAEDDPPESWIPRQPVPLDDPALDLNDSDGLRPGWTIAGTSITSAGTSSVSVVSDSEPIIVKFPRQGIEWLLDHYVDPGIAAHRAEFRRCLERILNISSPALDTLFSNPDEFAKLLFVSSGPRRKNVLVRAYESFYSTKRPDLNLTSLCLYSGLRHVSPLARVQQHSQITPDGIPTCHDDHRTGWLGTGDAKLNAEKRIGPFVEKFTAHGGSIRTMTLPHHASARSLRSDLLTQVDAPVYVGPGEGPKHPSQRVVEDVRHLGREPVIVGGTVGFTETFCITHGAATCGTDWDLQP